VENIEIEIPDKFELSQNYPNPFNPSTTIKFGIPENANVKLTIYNLLGQEVATLVNRDMSSGYYSIDWNAVAIGKQISSGIYFYNINAIGVSGNKFISTKKMILLK
jgi:flagellar hook assembly protein FlgD